MMADPLPDFIGYRVWKLADGHLMPLNGFIRQRAANRFGQPLTGHELILHHLAEAERGIPPLVHLTPEHRAWSGPVGTADKHPTWWNTSGLYANNDTIRGRRRFRTMLHLTDFWSVAGRVRFFGTVVEHEFGYRASHAVIECLAIQAASPDLVRKLEAQYQCLVKVCPSPERMWAFLHDRSVS
ncbi:MAG: hypothetical protein ABI647_26255 [Gemmatimonadota bacterium]